MIENSGSDLDREEACKIYYEVLTGKAEGLFYRFHLLKQGVFRRTGKENHDKQS